MTLQPFRIASHVRQTLRGESYLEPQRLKQPHLLKSGVAARVLIRPQRRRIQKQGSVENTAIFVQFDILADITIVPARGDPAPLKLGSIEFLKTLCTLSDIRPTSPALVMNNNRKWRVYNLVTAL